MGYFETLEEETQKLYDVARQARLKGYDIELEPEIPLAKDLAERVEGLVGPKGVAARIKELEDDLSREEVAFQIAREIVTKPDEEGKEDSMEVKEQKSDQATRTALAILTEGVVAAPLEGIAKIEIKQNFDQGHYLAVYFAGPIRSAGGTAAALAVLIGDYIRISLGLDRYKPTDVEIERYVEEVELYESEVTNLQYSPKPEEVRLTIKNVPVEITGEATDKIEVSNRDLERVETNNIRGGALLAMAEGIIQKAPKVIKYASKLKIDGWDWLEQFLKAPDSKSDEDSGKVDDKYMRDIIGGRPVLAYPKAKGGFRLRYGRSRNTGLAAMGVNPSTMEIVGFLAVGTQMKIERPGKGNCVVPCDTIEGPIVKLRDGSVVKVKSAEQGKEIKNQVEEILFLGDMLVAFGEFLRNNHVLLPAGWCEEWWVQTIENSPKYSGELDFESLEMDSISPKEAFELSEKYKVPLHPAYTYFYHDVTKDEINRLQNKLYQNIGDDEDITNLNLENSLIMDMCPEKRILEVIGVPHRVETDKIIIDSDDAYTLLNTLREPLNLDNDSDTIEAINEVSRVKIMAKAPTYLGGRVGRPEKTKERKMKPAPHSLFPIGKNGGSRRNIIDAAKKGSITVEMARCKCTKCRHRFIPINMSSLRIKDCAQAPARKRLTSLAF